MGPKPKEVSKWVLRDSMRAVKEYAMEPKDRVRSPEDLAQIIQQLDSGAINRKAAKEIFLVAFSGPVDVVSFISEHGLGQLSDCLLL